MREWRLTCEWSFGCFVFEIGESIYQERLLVVRFGAPFSGEGVGWSVPLNM